jgi:hypothetical protein
MDRSWPVLSGSLVAVGGLGLVQRWGLGGLLAIATATWAFAAVMTYALLADFQISVRRAIRLALVVTVAFLDLMGLLMLSPVLGVAGAAVAAITSPLVTRHDAWNRGRRALMTRKWSVDRRFAQIVAELEDDPSWRHGA